MKPLIVVLHYKHAESPRNLSSVFSDQCSFENVDIGISSNEKYPIGLVLPFFEESIAKTKNHIIDAAINYGYESLFIIEDDVKIVNSSIFDRYHKMMHALDYGIISYGHHKKCNRIFNKSVCPVLRLKLPFDVLTFNRTFCGAVIGYNLMKDVPRYDESIHHLENLAFLGNCVQTKMINHPGFYPDVDKSWECFNVADFNKSRQIDANEVRSENERIRSLLSFQLEINADKIVENVLEKLRRVT